MNATPIKHLVLIPMVALALAGCSTAPSQFYTLNSTATGDGASAAQYAVAVGPVSVPAVVDRPQFTVQVAPNRVAVDEFNRWAAPLSDIIARVVANDLALLLGTPRVATSPFANFEAAFRVTINVQRFETLRSATKQNEGVLVEAVWVVRKATSSAAVSGRTLAREPAQGTDFDALAAAHSRALAKVSADIAAAIRKEADAKP